MKKLCNLLVLVISLMIAESVSAQDLWAAYRKDGKILYTISDVRGINRKLGQTKCVKLSEHSGHVILNVENDKILVYHHSFLDEYYACSMKCPVCQENDENVFVRLKTVLMVECPKCHTQWQNVCIGSSSQTNRMGEYYLKDYVVYKRDGKLYICSGTIWQFDKDL